MNNITKNKLLVGLIALLVLGNIASIATFWLGKPKPPQERLGGTPASFLIKELNLDAKQQQQLEVLRNEHRNAAEPLRVELAEQKKAFFGLLQQPGADSNKINAEKAVLSVNEKLDLLAFDHFESIRKICREDQKEKFDSIVLQVGQMIGGPGGPRPGGNRPPPPHDDNGDRPPRSEVGNPPPPRDDH